MTVGHVLVGHGPSRVLVMHNWMATHASYAALWDLLDGETFTYAFMDHRGYGRSRRCPGPYTAAQATRDALALAGDLGWDRFHVVGHSMSGMIGQRLTLDGRDRVRSFVAISPVPASGMPLDPDGLDLFRGSASNDEQWLAISRMMTGNRLPEAWHRQQLHRFREAVSPEAYLAFLGMWTRTDFSAEMGGFEDLPSLIIAGAHDFPAFRAEALRTAVGRWYPRHTLEVLDAGHHPMLETPAYFTAVLERFLRAQVT